MCFFYQDSELSKNDFPNFPDVINVGETSKNDFIHFIGDIKNNPDLAVFKNTTGLFIKEGGAQRPLVEKFRDVTFQKERESFSFPFALKREHLMLLASGPEHYFLPFQNNAGINEFLEPNWMYSQHTIVTIRRRDRECLINERLGDNSPRPSWYITDSIVDFFGRWYVAQHS